MKRYSFKMTLESDIIMQAQAVTEGMPQTLDYIPGSNFLGIIAKDYKQFKDDNLAYGIFHGDSIRFGDAHIAQNNIKSFKAPLSWYYEKKQAIEDRCWVHHGLNDNLYQKLIEEGKQLKQSRSGWIADNKIINVHSNFAIKSAYDPKTRRSADNQLFTLKSFEAGSEWIFYVDIDKEKLNAETEKLIIDKLTGEHFIGKSKSAQYGKVDIKLLGDDKTPDYSQNTLFTDEENIKYLIVYAESRLIFYDNLGQATLQPKAKDFGLDENWTIDWGKSQIKHQIFAPYNFKNKSYLTDRVCIDKGSVFVFKITDKSDLDMKNLAQCVGEFQNEGFGQVIINPIFLNVNDDGICEYKIENATESEQNLVFLYVKESDDSDDIISAWINKHEEASKREKTIYESVTKFVKENKKTFGGISSSQWGNIRSIAQQSKDYQQFWNKLFTKPKEEGQGSGKDGKIISSDRSDAGFLMHGKAEKQWKHVREIFKKELEDKEKYGSEYGCEYGLRLATQMQKNASKGEK